VQRATLAAIYEVLVSSGDWPTFQHLDALAWGPEAREPREVFFELAKAELVTPALSVKGDAQLRAETKVALTPLGLGEVPAAAKDVEILLGCVRQIAQRAEEFRPPDPTVPVSLDISSTEVAQMLGLPPRDPALRRLGQLLGQAWQLWTSFAGPGDEGWSLVVDVAAARRYAKVQTLGDYLRLAGYAETEPQGAADAGEPDQATGEDAAHADQQKAGEARGTAATAPIRFQRSVAADLPTDVDLLGFDPLVKALHGLLNDANTVLPLAIAVTAPWGAGKSSVMNQLEAVLRKPPMGSTAQRVWTTVRFDAWKYERSERLWAALAKAIYRQTQRQMSWYGRLRFRARLELRRRGPVGSLLTLAWPLFVVGAIVVTILKLDPSGIDAVPGVLAGTAVLLAAVTRYGHALANPFQRAIERHARRPDYETHLGFTAEADRDIRVLTRLAAPDDRHGLAVFVDDLDRCSSAHLVEVVEAMNQIFNSAREHRCVFVLGLDRDIVATNIKVAYAATVEQLCKDRRDLGDRFGYEFLAKLVQLSVSIPEPAPAAMRTLLEKVTGNTAATASGGPPAGAALAQPGAEEAVERVQEHIQATAGESLESVAGAAAQITQAPAEVVAEAQRRELAERLEDSPEVAAAEFAALAYLERNPRQLKRFHNAFRLQLYVANEDQSVPFDFTAGELVALAKWVVVRLRWPELGNAITQDPQLLAVIEAEANQEPAAISVELATSERIEQRDRWLARAGVRALMLEVDADRRMGKLELKGFLRVA
jgi:hypothetical protein